MVRVNDRARNDLNGLEVPLTVSLPGHFPYRTSDILEVINLKEIVVKMLTMHKSVIRKHSRCMDLHHNCTTLRKSTETES